MLCTKVISAHFAITTSLWHVIAETGGMEGQVVTEYLSRWLVVATGENTESAVPEVKGRGRFRGGVVHTSEYKNGMAYRGKRVLAVGCGNSGMEVSLDLWEHGALPFLSVKSGVHLLPRDGRDINIWAGSEAIQMAPDKNNGQNHTGISYSTVGGHGEVWALEAQNWVLEHKFTTGKTPVPDDGTLALIKNGSIKILPKVDSFTGNGAKFVDGTEMGFNSVIFATGYKSNVPSWLKDNDLMVGDATLRKPSSDGWKGKNRCYYVGFAGTGLLGAAANAQNVALDIASERKKPSENLVELSS